MGGGGRGQQKALAPPPRKPKIKLSLWGAGTFSPCGGLLSRYGGCYWVCMNCLI